VIKEMRKVAVSILLLSLLVCRQIVVGQSDPGSSHSKSRLIVLADMGNERDEEQQNIHLLMYANEFNLEGLIAVSGLYLNSSYDNPYKRTLHPELYDTLVWGYSRIYENLKKHADDWPTPEYLRSIISTGQKDYGMADVGEGKSSPGSRLIISAVSRQDPRQVYVVVNAGSNTLAQAIVDFERSHSKAETKAFVEKLIVYENGAQDDAGAWIVSHYPQIHWIRSNYQTYGYGGTGKRVGPYAWQPYSYSYEGQDAWANENIRMNHGPLGALYPRRILREQFAAIEGGGTTPWLGLITRGLSNALHPGWGGWSGRYSSTRQDTVWSRHEKVAAREQSYGTFSVFADTADHWMDPSDSTQYDDIFAPIQRWRKHQFDDFKARMDWCVKSFDSANHNPVAVINKSSDKRITLLNATPGKEIVIDASASFDPDKNQTVSFSWWVYPEAGSYRGACKIHNSHQAIASLTVPTDAQGKQIHVILDVYDDSKIAVMHDYRRIVINVSQ
jgi:hypothetical protein